MADILAVLAVLGVGGLLGGWLRGRHERTEAHRERMISVASDFLTKVAEADDAVDEAERAVRDAIAHGSDPQRAQEAIDEVVAKISAAGTDIPKIALVFPTIGGNNVYQPARDSVEGLKETHGVLKRSLANREFEEDPYKEGRVEVNYWAGYVAGNANYQVWSGRLKPWPGEIRARRTLGKAWKALARYREKNEKAPGEQRAQENSERENAPPDL